MTTTAPEPSLDRVDGATEDGVTQGLAAQDGVLEELLVEEISIDGMCGVY